MRGPEGELKVCLEYRRIKDLMSVVFPTYRNKKQVKTEHFSKKNPLEEYYILLEVRQLQQLQEGLVQAIGPRAEHEVVFL